MSNPRLKTSHKIVPAGGELTFGAVGTVVFNLGSTAAEGEITLRIGDGDEVFFDAGTKYQLPDSGQFSQLTLINSGAGEADILLAVGDGDVTISNSANITNTVDVKNTTGNALFVKNETGGTLDVSDETAQGKLDTIDASAQAILAMQQDDKNQRKGLITLAGASFAELAGAGTNNVVTAGANTNGIIIRKAYVQAYTSSSSSKVLVGGNPVAVQFGSSYGSVSNGVENLFIPAGKALDLTNVTASTYACVWYEVL